MNKDDFIPFHRPSIGTEEIQEVVDTLRSGWLTTGPRVHRFEADFQSYTGARHALAVNSCTAALHVALAALGLGPGDEVITTPLTFCATVNTILHTGATAVLADIGPDGNIDPVSVCQRVTERTRAILPVHYAGQPCDLDALYAIADRHRLHVVEDAAHAAGTLHHAQHLGRDGVSRSAAVAFSFYATKNLTTAEGGMVTTNDPRLAETMRRLALHGITKDAWNRYAANGSWFYTVQEPGFKYNLTDVQAALGIHQLRRLEGFLAERTRLAALYTRLFEGLEEVEPPPEARHGRHAWHLYPIRLDLGRLDIDRAEFIEELRQQGVGASVHFIPIPLHPFFFPWAGLACNQCPNALALYPRLVSLPLFPGLTDHEVCRIAASVRSIVAAHRRARVFAASA